MPFQAMEECKNELGKELALFHCIPLKYIRKTELGIKALFSCDWKCQLTLAPSSQVGRLISKAFFSDYFTPTG